MAKTKKSDDDKKLALHREGYMSLLILPDEDEPKDMKKIERDLGGRPTVMTKQVFAKLEVAFKVDCTLGEAASFAGISRASLDRYREKNPGFDEVIQGWRDASIIKARQNIIGAVETGSLADSWLLLRAKRKAEFAEQKNIAPVDAISPDELNQAAAAGVIAIASED